MAKKRRGRTRGAGGRGRGRGSLSSLPLSTAEGNAPGISVDVDQGKDGIHGSVIATTSHEPKKEVKAKTPDKMSAFGQFEEASITNKANTHIRSLTVTSDRYVATVTGPVYNNAAFTTTDRNLSIQEVITKSSASIGATAMFLNIPARQNTAKPCSTDGKLNVQTNILERSTATSKLTIASPISVNPNRSSTNITDRMVNVQTFIGERSAVTAVLSTLPIVLPVAINQNAASTGSDGKLNVPADPEAKKYPDLDPFYKVRTVPDDYKPKKATKQLKKTRKDLKRLGNPRKVKKSLASFLGDKEKYNMEEMVREVQLGLKKGENESYFCSLASIVQRPPITGKIIAPFYPVQLSGFRLHADTPFCIVKGTENKVGDKTSVESFKVPALQEPRKKKTKTGRKS